MAQLNLKSLVSRLDDTARSTLEGAAGLALSRTNYDVEIEHWLLKLIDRQTSDMAVILSHFSVDAGRLTQDINRQIDRFKTGNGRAPGLAPNIVKLIKEAWLIASLEYGSGVIRSGHLLLALLGHDDLSIVARDASTHFAKIPVETLRSTMVQIAAGSEEPRGAAEAQAQPGAAPASGGPSAAARGGEALAKYTIDVTQQARDGKIDPIFGRDPEIRQIVDILTRRRQNNPILTGEAGVGKTAVVEGFALRIVQGDVPDSLKDVRLLSLDLGLLQAGAGIKGEFENRLKSVIEEVKSSATPIIVFIDEAHTLIGAGGAEGQNDAANLLKPALARGEMRTIAASTWSEYKKYFEKDPALTRRFQVIKVEEPPEALAVAMLRGLVPVLEKHHGVRILGEALESAAGLSHRYIAGRQLPDKAISLLDTACARVGISQAASPPALENVERQLGLLDSEVRMLEREGRAGIDVSAALEAKAARRAELEAEREALSERWKAERDAVKAVGEARAALDGLAPDSSEAESATARLREAQAKVRELQGETPMVYDVVDGHVVAEVLAGWTGIPVGRMVSDEIRSVLSVGERLSARIKGQAYALDVIAQTVRTARAGLADPRKPLGVFLFCGTSGVGKTETALALAELLYGGEQNVTTINMSEFKEEHKVSTLVGAAPGYVGYGEGGVLTEAVRRKPYSVVLLDEMEKAHPGVQDVFYQVFDKGMLKDGQGRDIDFKNTLIIMTSNAGTETIEELCRNVDTLPEPEELAKALRPALLEYFKPAFLGRVVTVPFFPLPPEILREIVVISLERIRKRVTGSYGAAFEWDDALLDRLVARCTEVESGARNIENILKRGMLADLAEQLLVLRADGKDVAKVRVTAGDEKDYAFVLS
ncbi:type VI secretion system ATPase TssH [Sphingomonas sp. MAH-20]|uniref:Type VI secretion system ATPase TssH n=1 Tax=Sphingomonas horti TaxID=2682842 RepID=A0A6I4IXV3_9SPHN|nr:type VI secretion system ATPase TssH [Sphingomonas sp. CGMCC 1.13658]MBA2920546.1 type VI secretion system ATPase TssH [Sphingomonas sp. CGMCC 1.13658]MVO76798.1 type VI secretion system ATPase TssH [Sphingomonas horti]